MIKYMKNFVTWISNQKKIEAQLRKQANTLDELNKVLDCMLTEVSKKESTPPNLKEKINNKYPAVKCPVCSVSLYSKSN